MADTAESSPAPRVVAPPPATPIRFGIVDMWLLSMLFALHIAVLFYLFDIRLGQDDTTRRVTSIVSVCLALLTGASYLAHRVATAFKLHALSERLCLIVACEVLIAAIVFIIGLCLLVMFSFLPLFPVAGIVVVFLLIAYGVTGGFEKSTPRRSRNPQP